MRKITKIILTLLFYCCVIGSQQGYAQPEILSLAKQKQVKKLFFEALDAKNARNFDKAVNLCNEILKIDSEEDAALFELASIYMTKSQPDLALPFAEKATKINPKNEWYWMLLCDIQQQKKDYKELINTLNNLIALNSKKVEYYQNKAVAYVLTTELDSALSIYNLIENRFGHSENTVTGKYKIYVQQGRSEKAIQELEVAIKAMPTEMRYVILLADLYINLQQKEKALQILQNGQKIVPDNIELLLKIADVYLYLGKEDLAMNTIKQVFEIPNLDVEQKVRILLGYVTASKDKERDLERIEELTQILLKNYPQEGIGHSVYAGLLTMKNQFKEAIQEYKLAVKYDAKNYQNWENLIRLQLAQKQVNQAITDAQEALTLFPNQTVLNYLLGLAYAQNKEHQNAIDFFTIASNLPAENIAYMAQVYIALGDSYFEILNSDASFAAYEKALKIEPKNPYALNNYAYYLSLKDKELHKAEKMALLANELEPNNASFEDTYAWVLFKQKKYKKAKEWMEKALEKEKSATQYEHYGDILYKLGETNSAIIQWELAKKNGSDSLLLKKKLDEKKYYE